MANAYDEDIYVKVVNDKASETIRNAIDVTFKGVNIGRQNTQELAAQHGFTPIASGSYLAFAPDAAKTAYITIYTESGRIVCKNYNVHENRSVKVNKDGYLREVEYGSIWKER